MSPLAYGVAAPWSPLARVDARAKLCGAFGAVLAVSTYPAGAGWRYAAALLLLAALLGLARVPPRYVLRRCLAAAPFVAMAALLPFASAAADWRPLAAAVALKACAAVLALSALAATTPLEDVVGSLRHFGAPRGLTLTAVLMHRYLFALLEEWRRMERARECRTGGRLRSGRTRVRANQVAMVFVRGWERAERVAQGLLVRGFQGEFPRLRSREGRTREFAFGLGLPMALLALRFA